MVDIVGSFVGFWVGCIQEASGVEIFTEEKFPILHKWKACGHLRTLENELKDNKFFGGEKIGVVDIVANFIGFWVGCIKEASGVEILTEEKFPKLHKWSVWKALWSKEKDRKEAVEEACEHLKTLENELKDKKFFGGENFGIVDIAAIFIGFWVGVIEEASGYAVKFFTEEKFPILHKWSNEFLNCDVVKEKLPAREQLIAFFGARFAASS
ncbi:hypothetical protein Pint_35294 [Pistacia integerrima]|uniref:Uncharacterized protein n=1 Tax=Pistacia integerrima TaxID=434235 RepID=A0ACC0Y1B6_9ROSI|nr:hypothetical protein Pint_35294 [Pistacia integerrima]